MGVILAVHASSQAAHATSQPAHALALVAVIGISISDSI